MDIKKDPQIIHEILPIVEQDTKEQSQQCNAIKAHNSKKTKTNLDLLGRSFYP